MNKARRQQDSAQQATHPFRVEPNNIVGASGFVIIQDLQDGRAMYAGRDLTFRPHRTHCPFETEQEASQVLLRHLQALEDARAKHAYVVRSIQINVPLAPAEDRHDAIRLFPRLDIDQTRAVESVFRALRQTSVRLSNSHPIENHADAVRWVFEQIAAAMRSQESAT